MSVRAENGTSLFVFPWSHTCRILVPRPGIEPMPSAMRVAVLTTGPPGNPWQQEFDGRMYSPESSDTAGSQELSWVILARFPPWSHLTGTKFQWYRLGRADCAYGSVTSQGWLVIGCCGNIYTMETDRHYTVFSLPGVIPYSPAHDWAPFIP